MSSSNTCNPPKPFLIVPLRYSDQDVKVLRFMATEMSPLQLYKLMLLHSNYRPDIQEDCDSFVDFLNLNKDLAQDLLQLMRGPFHWRTPVSNGGKKLGAVNFVYEHNYGSDFHILKIRKGKSQNEIKDDLGIIWDKVKDDPSEAHVSSILESLPRKPAQKNILKNIRSIIIKQIAILHVESSEHKKAPSTTDVDERYQELKNTLSGYSDAYYRAHKEVSDFEGVYDPSEGWPQHVIDKMITLKDSSDYVAAHKIEKQVSKLFPTFFQETQPDDMLALHNMFEDMQDLQDEGTPEEDKTYQALLKYSQFDELIENMHSVKDLISQD